MYEISEMEFLVKKNIFFVLLFLVLVMVLVEDIKIDFE